MFHLGCPDFGGGGAGCQTLVRGLNRQGGVPAFLEWDELLAEAGQSRRAAAVSPQEQVLVADFANQFFTDLFDPIDRVPALRKKDDHKIMLFNRIIDYARQDGEAGIRSACGQYGLGSQAIRRVLKTIGWYRQKIEPQEFKGAAVPRGYQTFLLQPGGRGGHRYFTGQKCRADDRPIWKTGDDRQPLPSGARQRSRRKVKRRRWLKSGTRLICAHSEFKAHMG